MGIDRHLYNLLRWQAAEASLGDVLTIGRMSLDVPIGDIKKDFPASTIQGPYAESLLTALGAHSVSSIDASAYEAPTFVGDLNREISHDSRYSTVIDGGSLEHVFDVAQAFWNLTRLCEVGGRIMRALPVNNLNGHGFWQFCSDLMYSVYREEAGFSDTKVFYASTLNYGCWYLAPPPKSGSRVEIVSVEPVILLCVTRKVREVEFASPVQPYYSGVWEGSSPPKGPSIAAFMKKVLRSNRKLLNPVRNAWTIGGLASGFSPYSMRGPLFKRIDVVKLLASVNP